MTEPIAVTICSALSVDVIIRPHALILAPGPAGVSAVAIAVLSLLGAAGERIGYDRWLKANTVKRRTHSLFRQGLMLYHHLPNWPEDRVRPLMATFGSMLMEQRVYREVFGVI